MLTGDLLQSEVATEVVDNTKPKEESSDDDSEDTEETEDEPEEEEEEELKDPKETLEEGALWIQLRHQTFDCRHIEL